MAGTGAAGVEKCKKKRKVQGSCSNEVPGGRSMEYTKATVGAREKEK